MCRPRWPCTSGPAVPGIRSHVRHDDRIAQQPATPVFPRAPRTCARIAGRAMPPTLNVAAEPAHHLRCAAARNSTRPAPNSSPSTRPAPARPAPAPASCATVNRAALVPGRVEKHRRRRGAAMGLAHVGPHETGVRRDGRAHQRAVQRTHARRTRHRIQRAGRQKAYSLQAEERRRFRRTRLHLLQRRVHGGERARQSQGREGPEARGPSSSRRAHAPDCGGTRL